jgi:hypothetical protein
VLDWSEPPERQVTGVRSDEAGIELATAAGAIGFRFGPSGLVAAQQGREWSLGGLRPAVVTPRSLFEERPAWDAAAEAPHAWEPPAVDGSLDGFDLSAPVELAGEPQYRRSEEPYDESFGAQAWVNWDREAFYLAVAVTKPEVVVRPEDAPPLNLDNEPEDIHSDGIQVYFRLPDGAVRGEVLTLAPDGRLAARTVAGLEARGPVTGSWSLTDEGYLLTAKLPDPVLAGARQGARVGFDLLVNEARPHRLRRAGQLVWSGGEGWVYLRGDRQDPARFGRLLLG